ncbi:MAG: plasmid pRiA4b ORF-3 family protein [Saprospiraceae bacterium]|nr:plasmid pRiA4b ORF-3 family protein [Saprospiraceae bacterium]MDW8230375.1 plasmid pRiA4b ORF-3 family protein [Saprospiraceae bacterium]
MASKKILDLEIVLKDISPKIYRRVLVPDNLTFSDLHDVIQASMGWDNAHLYQFIVGRGSIYIGPPPLEYDLAYDDDGWEDGSQIEISQILCEPKVSVIYEYDMGDSWMHQVTVKKVLDPEPGKTYPWLVEGKRACPPEDCGGVLGYYDIVEAMEQPSSEAYQEYVEWLGGEYDPEYFGEEDIQETNRFFQEYFK